MKQLIPLALCMPGVLAYGTSAWAASASVTTSCESEDVPDKFPAPVNSTTSGVLLGNPAICAGAYGGPLDERGHIEIQGKATGRTEIKEVGVLAESIIEVKANKSNGDSPIWGDSFMFSRSFGRFTGFVTVKAKDENGNPVRRGFMTVSAARTGELRVDTANAVFDGTSATTGFELSFARLTYSIKVNDEQIIGSTVSVLAGENAKSFPVESRQEFWDGNSPLQFTMEAEVKAMASARAALAGTKIHALALFSNTLAWAGISNVTDEFGNPVASFTALGEDGVDWSTAAAVPVPSAVWFLGSALGGLGFMRRRSI